jgi:hypothetical protein
MLCYPSIPAGPGCNLGVQALRFAALFLWSGECYANPPRCCVAQDKARANRDHGDR